MSNEKYTYRRTFVDNTKPVSLKNRLRQWVTDKVFGLESIFDATKPTDIITGLVKKVGLAISSQSTGRDFESPTFDLSQINDAWRADGYIRQAVDKYVDLIFKPGYDITGKNLKAVEYVKTRLLYMAEVTGNPMDILFNEITTDFVKFNNAIIAKARSDDKLVFPPGGKITGLGDQLPVAGYFVLPMHTMQVKRDKFGIIKMWQQTVGDNKPVKLKPTDIIHIYNKRESGEPFAYPSLLSVIDDVRALREIEERVLHMIYRNVHPLIHVKVGNKEMPGTGPEVDALKAEIDGMTVEGGLVTTDRVVVDTINTKSVIDANVYLEYFENRVFTGLAVSGMMMGRGDSSNRSTGDNQHQEAVDRVKSYQKVLSTLISYAIIWEILREGGFDPLNKPEDRVDFIFKDPDTDSKIKHEAHTVFLYQSNAITENEMRTALGKDPIPDAEREMMWFPQYGEKDTQAQADNTIKPENQHGKNLSPKKSTKNTFEYLANSYISDMYGKIANLVSELYNDSCESKLVRQIHIKTIISNIDCTVAYTEKQVNSLVKELAGEEELGKIHNSIHNIFKSMYDFTVDTIADISTQSVITETLSAIFDVIAMELNNTIQLTNWKEEHNNEG